jgi:hypothetical protein
MLIDIVRNPDTLLQISGSLEDRQKIVYESMIDSHKKVLAEKKRTVN